MAVKDATSGVVVLGGPHATDLTAATAVTSCRLIAGEPVVVPWDGVI